MASSPTSGSRAHRADKSHQAPALGRSHHRKCTGASSSTATFPAEEFRAPSITETHPRITEECMSQSQVAATIGSLPHPNKSVACDPQHAASMPVHRTTEEKANRHRLEVDSHGAPRIPPQASRSHLHAPSSRSPVHRANRGRRLRHQPSTSGRTTGKSSVWN